MTHQHQPTESRTRCFTGPISSADYNPSAHGCVQVTERCSCGAVRRSNINGRHEEVGRWYDPTVDERERLAQLMQPFVAGGARVRIAPHATDRAMVLVTIDGVDASYTPGKMVARAHLGPEVHEAWRIMQARARAVLSARNALEGSLWG